MVFLEEVLEKVNFEEEKNQQTTKKHVKLPSMQRVNFSENICRMLVFIRIALLHYVVIHHENTSMQYTVIFHGCKNDNFQMKKCYTRGVQYIMATCQ